MLANTSCSVTNSSFGPPRAMSLSGVPFAMPLATAAGMTARPAISATIESAMTMRAEFLTMFSFLSRYEP